MYSMCICIYVYIYIYIHICTFYVYIYIDTCNLYMFISVTFMTSPVVGLFSRPPAVQELAAASHPLPRLG